MLTKEEVERVVASDVSIRDFCRERGISTVTFHNWRRRYGVDSKNEKSQKKIQSSVGCKYNRWLVLEYVGRTETSNGMLRCKCDCGTEQNVRYYDLVSGQTQGCHSCSTELKSKNCGKYKRKFGKDNWKFNGYEKLSGHQWAVLKYGAKKRGLEFTITTEYAYKILEKQGFKCFLSNLPIELGNQSINNGRWTATLDRIDSTKGYIEGNVQWLHKDINTMKWAFTQEQFIDYCRLVTENNNQ